MDPVAPTPNSASEDSGLASLAIVGRFHGIPVDPVQLRHDFAKARALFTPEDLVLAARRLGLKAKAVSSDWSRLAATALPALVQQKDGAFLVAAKIVEDRILLHDTRTNAPVALTRAEFEDRWSGLAILATKRSLLPGMSGRFDLSWFIPSVVKYRKQFGEVITASLFLQILALVTPLFFQVIIDKVLVHNGMSTLDVLAIGLLLVAIFEVLLGGLRTYLFSHTTNRVDVELGAKLYHHLQRLPIAFFQSRPVGTVVARLRELENVRSFITGSALTVAIDAVFTVVFFAVMYFHSATLFWVVFATIPCYAALSYFVTPILRNRLDDKFSRTAESQAFLVESVHAGRRSSRWQSSRRCSDDGRSSSRAM
jgi:ATP-binding cassette, subfamily B, bacterial HlyB/CyaB